MLLLVLWNNKVLLGKMMAYIADILILINIVQLVSVVSLGSLTRMGAWNLATILLHFLTCCYSYIVNSFTSRPI